MLRRTSASVLAALLAALMPPDAQAQTDYRNLDDDRPTLIEDAYPTELWAFEFVLPFRAAESGGRRVFATIPELTFGALPNVHVGIKAPLADVNGTSTVPSARGLSGLRAFALWNFNTESASLPALAVRGDLILPVGSLGESQTTLLLKGLATRSFGVVRVHLNVAGSIGRITPVGAPVEGATRWYAGAAVDRTFWRSSVIAIAELTTARRAGGEPLAWTALGGTRVQLTPYLVLDVGAGRTFGGERGWISTVGLTRQFAIDGLMRRPR